MTISNGKQQLAKIISENGGWFDGANWAVQGRQSMGVGFSKSKPYRKGDGWFVNNEKRLHHFATGSILPNWHQTIVSRDEYFHLYPAPDADGWIVWEGGECPCPGASGVARRRDGKEIDFSEGEDRCWSHGKSCMPSLQIVAYRIRKPAEPTVAAPERIIIEKEPTIEQLASDYRAKLTIAQQAQEEADLHRCGAEAALETLVAAGKALGLVLSVAEPETKPEMVVTESGDLLEGDVIELTAGERYFKTECTMAHIPGVGLRAKSADDTEELWWNLDGHQESEWRFIRRP